MRLTTGREQRQESFFVSVADWMRRKQKPFATAKLLANGNNVYLHLETGFWKVFNQYGFGREETVRAWKDAVVDPFKAIKRKTFNIGNIARPDWGERS